MRKLLLLLFLFSTSSNVFADEFDEFEEFEELTERKHIACRNAYGRMQKFSTDGENLYEDPYTFPSFNYDESSGIGVIKKEGKLKFINISYVCTKEDEFSCSSDELTKITEFIDFENTIYIVKMYGKKTIWACTGNN